MSELAKHILANAVVYIKEYSKREKLNDYEKGILHGIWICVDSVKNHLEMEEENIDIDIEAIMNDLQTLIDK